MAIVAAGFGLGESQQLDGRRSAQWAVRYCDFRSLLAEKREHLELGGGEQHRVRFQLRLFHFNISPECRVHAGGELIFSGAGIQQSSVLQTFGAGEAGQIVFNNTSTAGHATIGTGGELMGSAGGQTIFNDSSTADSATLVAYGGS